jgi:hypothetical protein
MNDVVVQKNTTAQAPDPRPLTGPERLRAFYELPAAMQAAAWVGLRRRIEHERDDAA